MLASFPDGAMDLPGAPFRKESSAAFTAQPFKIGADMGFYHG